ncbi:winged helix-turn-helix domain-containing protein [Geobacter pelophilus]|uniref:Winged helix-turn-helix domain-containing protein n=1 Tax=Geoanaerobacter pelophilus TaxID=60036 RepID=A0AAW4LEP3_9BACT|nr:metalloregulator ArsR/SmtB family transcription factor [Geoanaerobacter pelophilus]MBT0666474.1 winged helix-turn-helix domain-containing protein [Geoanaerobacter pelophilus]
MSDISTFRADILKALAQPTRLKIIEFLRDGERCVCEIFPAIGEEQSNTSRHLSMMLSSGVLSRRKDGLKIYYAIKHPEILDVVDMVTLIVKQEISGRHKVLKAL